MRRVAVLGSTGSIGRQALQVMDNIPERFEVAALSAHINHELLFEQVRKYRPRMAGLACGEVEVPQDLRFCEWCFGPQALEQLAAQVPYDDILVAVSGMVGLRAVLAARQLGHRVLLANKEALVAGGKLVMDCSTVFGEDPTLIPVDSEHSAIYQCLQESRGNAYRRLILTASGGPFLHWPTERMKSATLQEALRHPNWSMGAKITIDSASMFNKCLEIIEAKWLFAAPPEQIDVLIHPQSIVHSMVEFADGALLAQMGVPSMLLPIQYAMTYPQRLPAVAPRLDWSNFSALEFLVPNPAQFPALSLAYQALREGGASACILNAANEKAASAFLAKRIDFGQIFETVNSVMEALGYLPADTLEHIETADSLARRKADVYIQAYDSP